MTFRRESRSIKGQLKVELKPDRKFGDLGKHKTKTVRKAMTKQSKQ